MKPDKKYPANPGALEVICGPMFSGKTKKLFKKIETEKNIQVFKPSYDTRSAKGFLQTHCRKTIPAQELKKISQIHSFIRPGIKTVAIDEAQAFGKSLVPVTHALLKNGYNVVISGLSVMYNHEPFSPIPELMAEADRVTKLNARCKFCGRKAVFHLRTAPVVSKKVNHKSFVGGSESYAPVCRNCAQSV